MNQDTRYKLLDMLEYDELDVLKRMGYTWKDPYDIIFKFEDLTEKKKKVVTKRIINACIGCYSLYKYFIC